MTDNSNAAPERIWALPDLTQEWAKDGGLGDRPYDHLADQYVEYIRADLASAQVAAAYDAAAVVADMEAYHFTGLREGRLFDNAAKEMRALTPDDASAALAAMFKAERAKAYERVIEHIEYLLNCVDQGDEIRVAIRALAQEDE